MHIINIKQRDSELKKVIEIANKKIDLNSNEKLSVSISNGNTQFYIKTPEMTNSKGKYIKKSDYEKVKKLVYQDYYTNILDRAIREEYHIRCLNKIYDGNTYEEYFDTLNPAVGQMINPIKLSDNYFIKKWLSERSEIKSSYEIDGNIITNKGEAVRSKSEKIIADILDKYGVPYKYEECLTFDDGSVVFPDFTILDVKRRREVYLEHLGLMDNVEYVNRTMEKIKKYENNGIFPGVNLLITTESGNNKFNTKAFERMISSWSEL